MRTTRFFTVALNSTSQIRQRRRHLANRCEAVVATSASACQRSPLEGSHRAQLLADCISATEPPAQGHSRFRQMLHENCRHVSWQFSVSQKAPARKVPGRFPSRQTCRCLASRQAGSFNCFAYIRTHRQDTGIWSSPQVFVEISAA